MQHRASAAHESFSIAVGNNQRLHNDMKYPHSTRWEKDGRGIRRALTSMPAILGFKGEA
jgi:hypothetical protein